MRCGNTSCEHGNWMKGGDSHQKGKAALGQRRVLICSEESRKAQDWQRPASAEWGGKQRNWFKNL